MTSPYFCYRELLPNTSIICSSFFTYSNNNNIKEFLICATISTLRIYHVINIDNNKRLSLLVQFKLFGKVRDICTYTPKSKEGNLLNEEVIVLSLDIGKIVIFRFDIIQSSLELLYLLNAEENASGIGSEVTATTHGQRIFPGLGDIPYLSIDKFNLIACSIIYGQQLLFIPLKQQLFRNANTLIKNTENVKDNNYMSGLKDTFELQDRFIVDLGDDMQLFGIILDFCFLSGYSQPTLAVLQESGLPIGHAAAVRNSCTITVLAVDVLSKSLSIVWQQPDLPHDCIRLQTLSSNSLKYSLALITMNAVLLVNSSEVVGIATNGFASITVASHIQIRPWEYTEGIELDKSRWIEAHENCIVGSLKDGRIMSINFLIQEGLSLRSAKFDVEFLGKSCIVSTMCVSSKRDLWFLGSRTADSFLMGVSCNSEDVPSFSLNNFLAKSDTSASFSTPASKKAKKSNPTPKISIEPSDLDNQMEIEQSNLYGSSLVENAKKLLTLSLKRFVLNIADTVPAIGPILNGVFCAPDDSLDNLDQLEIKVAKAAAKANISSAGSYIAPAEAKDFLKLSAGVDDEGAVFKVNRGFKMSKIASRGFPGAINVSTLTPSCSPNTSYMIVSYVKKTKVLQCFSDDNSTELPIKEIVAGNIGFLATEMTIKTAFIATDVAVQVHEHGLRTIKFSVDPSNDGAIEGNPLQDVLAVDSEELGGLGVDQDDSIASCSLCQDWVAVITSKKKIFILQYDAKDEYLNIIHKGSFIAGNSSNSNSFESYITSIPVNVSLFHGIVPESIDTDIAEDIKPERDIEYLEQIYLYGKELEGSAIESDAMDIEEKGIITKSEDTYVIICDIAGLVTLLRLSDMKCILRTFAISNFSSHFFCEDVLLADDLIRQNNDEDEVNESSKKCVSGRYVEEILLTRLSKEGAPYESSRLCFVALLDTGDLGVYFTTELSDETVCFSKLEHNAITRKRRRMNNNKKEKSNNDINTTNTNLKISSKAPGSLADNSKLRKSDNNASSDDWLSANKLSYIDLINGGNAIVISGIRPHIIMNSSGLPTVMPIGLPEIPYFNNGQYYVEQLRVGKTTGLVTLWQETELNDSKGSTKQATLGLYIEMPDQIYLDGGIISFKKINVGMTVHQIMEVQPRTDERTEQELLNPNHNPNRRTYLLLCSEEVDTPFLPNILTEEEKQKEAELYERFLSLDSFSQPDKAVGAPPPLKLRKYKIAFIQNGKCVGIHELPEGENVLGMEVAYLTLEKVQPKIGQIIIPNKITRRVFIVVSTSITDKHGEDTQGYGNLLFFGLDIARFDKQEETENDIAESKSEQVDVPVPVSVGAAAAATTQSDFYASIQPKLVLIHKGPGPASIVKQCGENIISTVGSVVYVYKLIPETMKLEQIAFYFAKFYIVSISIIKNYVLLSDFGHSVQLLVWREADRSLNPVSRDYENCVCLSTSFVPVSTALGMVCGDDEGNIQILQCHPQKKAESLDGQKLLCSADFHLGSDVGVQVVHPLLTLPPGVPPGLLVEADSTVVRSVNKISTRQLTPNTVSFDTRISKGSTSNCVVLGTVDGGLGILVPVDERVYRRLNLLQQLMSMVVQTPCALNPQEFRLMKTRRYKFQRQKGLLDGTLLWKFPTLDAELQEEIVKALGVTIDTVMESLQEVDLLASFF